MVVVLWNVKEGNAAAGVVVGLLWNVNEGYAAAVVLNVCGGGVVVFVV